MINYINTITYKNSNLSFVSYSIIFDKKNFLTSANSSCK